MSASVTDILKRNKIMFNEDVYDIQMISNKKLYRSKFQFYVERDIEQFADEIEVVGKILQPLVVRELNIGYYEILAGHRRYLSAILNADTKGLNQFSKTPCYCVDVDDVMAEYILIKTNASREKDAWEQMYEIERLKWLIPRLPANRNLRGRLQDHVVAELGLTKSVVGRYEHVANKLSEKGKEWLKEGRLNITIADKLASFHPDAQEHLLDEFGHDLQILNQAVTKNNITKPQKSNPMTNPKEIKQDFQQMKAENSNVEGTVVKLDIFNKKNISKSGLIIGTKATSKTKSLFEKLYYGDWDADDITILGFSLEQIVKLSSELTIADFKDYNTFRLFYENMCSAESAMVKIVKHLKFLETDLKQEGKDY